LVGAAERLRKKALFLSPLFLPFFDNSGGLLTQSFPEFQFKLAINKQLLTESLILAQSERWRRG
jgi:hypothetical protein